MYAVGSAPALRLPLACRIGQGACESRGFSISPSCTMAYEALTDKQERFCREYIIDLNGTRAAKVAGASAKSAHVQANKWLKLGKIQARISELQTKALATPEGQAAESERVATLEQLEGEAAAVIAELRNHGFANLFRIIEVTEDGGIRCRSLDDLPEDVQRQVKKVKVRSRTRTTDDGTETETEYEVELWDKIAALRLLAQHMALLEGKKSNDDDEPREVKVTMIIPKAAG